MHPEIEGKWLNIDLDEMRERLRAAGVRLEQPERRMTRSVFDFPDGRLNQKNGWARVRDEGDKITMSYKQLNDRSATGTHEVNLTVDNYENACHFLQELGLEQQATQQTSRESWKLGDVEIELDTWPWIPSFIEIEAESEELLRVTAEKLGLDYAQVLHGSVEIVYQAVYDVTEAEVDAWPDIRFSAVPEWLEEKRR
jgi:adenylate cyclase class 2